MSVVRASAPASATARWRAVPHPRALAGWCAAAATVALATTNPWMRLMVLLVALNVLAALRLRDRSPLPLLAALSIGAIVTTLLNALTSHTGSDVIARIPQAIPGIGGTVTVEAVVYGVTTALGIAAAAVAIAPLALAVTADDIVDALPRVLERTGAAIGMALTLVPRLLRNISEIRESASLRGYAAPRRLPLRSVVTPAFLVALDDSMNLAEAMEARGFGAATRTYWRAAPLTACDVVVVVLAVTAAVLTFVASSNGAIPPWYPFPSLTLPPFPIAVPGVTLLLAAPLGLWLPARVTAT